CCSRSEVYAVDMRLRISWMMLIALALALAGCPGPPSPSARPPDLSETPPTTRDPGAVEDEQPLQPRPPPGSEAGSPTRPAGKPTGAACLAAGDCASGVCEGEGCTAD